MSGNGAQCGRQCRYGSTPKGHSDAAKRISDAATLAWVFHGWDGSVGRWMAFALEDGATDHTIYDSKRDAVLHVANELNYAFFKLHPMGMSVCEAEIMLQFTRDAVKRGFRLVDPDKMNGGPDLIPRIGSDTVSRQLYALRKAGG
jgi:hypothetical protein